MTATTSESGHRKYPRLCRIEDQKLSAYCTLCLLAGGDQKVAVTEQRDNWGAYNLGKQVPLRCERVGHRGTPSPTEAVALPKDPAPTILDVNLGCEHYLAKGVASFLPLEMTTGLQTS